MVEVNKTVAMRKRNNIKPKETNGETINSKAVLASGYTQGGLT